VTHIVVTLDVRNEAAAVAVQLLTLNAADEAATEHVVRLLLLLASQVTERVCTSVHAQQHRTRTTRHTNSTAMAAAHETS
jgi:hypothetical protein